MLETMLKVGVDHLKFILDGTNERRKVEYVDDATGCDAHLTRTEKRDTMDARFLGHQKTRIDFDSSSVSNHYDTTDARFQQLQIGIQVHIG